MSGPKAKFLVTNIDKPRQDGSEPEDPTDPHEMLRKYWPGSRVRIIGPIPDRQDLTGSLATVSGANDEGQYQIVVLSPTESPVETIFVDIIHIEPILSLQHPKYRKGHAPSCFPSPNKLLRFRIGQKVQAYMVEVRVDSDNTELCLRMKVFLCVSMHVCMYLCFYKIYVCALMDCIYFYLYVCVKICMRIFISFSCAGKSVSKCMCMWRVTAWPTVGILNIRRNSKYL